MTDQELLKCYTDFVPFLAAVCGPGCEIVIHDVTNPEQSIIAIGNGISGRELGDPMTDLARELQEKGTYADTECLLNYKGKTKSGEFLSSTYFHQERGTAHWDALCQQGTCRCTGTESCSARAVGSVQSLGPAEKIRPLRI
ncbi:MAG: PAS domain-containing protein [Faecalibacterium sp.]